MRIPSLALALLVAVTTGPALAEPEAGGDRIAGGCFRMSQIRNHRIADKNTIYMRVDRDKVYRIAVGGACAAGAMRDETLVLTPFGGTDLICRPIDLDLRVRQGDFASPCIIQSITLLTAEAVAALPPKDVP